MQPNECPSVWIVLSNNEIVQVLANIITSINPNIRIRTFGSYLDAFNVIRVLERAKLPSVVYLGCTFPNEGTAVDFITLMNDYYLQPQFDIHLIAKTYTIENLDKLLENRLIKGWYPNIPTKEVVNEVISNL